MERDEWRKRVTDAIRSSRSDPSGSAETLVGLADQIEAASRDELGDYEICQALSLAAGALEQVQGGEPALVPSERLIQILKKNVRYFAGSLVDAYSFRALILFTLNQPEEAKQLVEEALRVAAVSPGSSIHLEKALTALREYQLQRERSAG